jgi:hypothetical protein
MSATTIPQRRRRAGARERLELPAERLRRRLDPGLLPLALDAIEFGLAVGSAGYNLFLTGAPGSGRLTTALDLLASFSATLPPPPDQIYVHDFAEPDRPKAILLPSGRGGELARTMDEFLRAARRELRRAFESEEYERRQRELLTSVSHRRDRLVEELQAFARERGFVLEITPAGTVSMPLHAGQPLSK